MKLKRILALLLLPAVAATAAAADLSKPVEIVRTFRQARHSRGNTNIFRQQPIDSASWIWKKDAPAKCFLYMGKTFETREGDGDLTLDVSADERFVLMLDGKLVARGPNRGTPENWQYHTYTIKNLAPGSHRLTAKVWTIGDQAPLAQLSYRGGFILKADGVYDERLTTGKAEWQVAVCDSIKTLWTEGGPWGTGCRFELSGWGAEPQPGAVWEKAEVVRGPAGLEGNNGYGARTQGWMLFPSQMPDQTEIVQRPGEFRAATHAAAWRAKHYYTAAEEKAPEVELFNAKLRDPAKPLTIPPKTRLQLAWHLGRYTCAYPQLTASGEGARISWNWAEAPREQDGHKRQRDALTGKSLEGYGDIFICGKEPAFYTVPWFRCGLWCRIDIETGDAPLTIHDFNIVESRYPVEMESEFSSTAMPDLQDIRRISARAMQMCAHEMLFDCPYYEQQMYPGDSRVQLNVLSALSRDDRLIKRAIEIFNLATRDDGTCPMNFPTRGTQESMAYTLCYLCMYGDYVMNHDDFDWLRARLPGMRMSMAGAELYENAEGLLEDIPGWCFMDWTIEWHLNHLGCAPKSRVGEGPSAEINLFWALALKSAATTERAFGNVHLAEHWEAKYERLKSAIIEKFWCERRGLLADTPDLKHFSEHAQALAICADVLEGERRERAFAHLIADEDLSRCTVYFSYYLFEAYFKMGRGDLFLNRLDLWRSYLKLGVTTLLEMPENGGPDGSWESRSDCHAWGAHPILFMQTGLAGISSTAPGFKSVRVAPAPGSLPDLKAKHPHPKGWIEVNLKFADGEASGTVSTPVEGVFVYGDYRQELHPGVNRIGSGEPQWIAGDASVSMEKCGAPCVAKTFTLAEKPRQATLALAVCGWHELSVNGSKVGDRVLSPVTCQPDCRIGEIVYDLSGLLDRGTNTIEVLLGNGWWSQLTGEIWGFGHAPWHFRSDGTDGHRPPMFRAELTVDGRRRLVSDTGWRAWDSPIVFNQFRTGEHYDARLEGRRPNERAAAVCRPPAGVVTRETMPPCRAFASGEPVRTIAAADGSTIYDFGRNIAGWCEIELEGPAGATVKLDYDESLDGTGKALKHRVHQLKRSFEPAMEHDEFVCSGRAGDRYEPRFTYHGFRYVQVSAPAAVKIKQLRAKFVHTAFAPAGDIATSDPLFARLQAATRQSYLSNFVGIPTDCPHREKNGWTGDAQLACETGLWNFDAAEAYRHFLQMVLDAQRPNGAVPCILPANPIFGYGWGTGPAWDAILFTLPREIFRFTGDDRPAREAYEAMKRYRRYADTKRHADGLFEFGLGDWCPPEGHNTTTYNLTDSAIVWSFDRDLEFWARRFGDEAEAKAAADRAAAIREAFNRKFYRGGGVYCQGQPTALAAALYFRGLCADGAEQAVVSQLVATVRAKNHKCDFGILGAKWVPRVLAEYGYGEDAWQLFLQREYPGYQHWFDRGEDTLWEDFEGRESHNHIMFGDVSAWAFEYIAGIRPLEPGFGKIAFKPFRPAGVADFEARHRTPYGEIRAGWRTLPDGKVEFFCHAPDGVKVVREGE